MSEAGQSNRVRAAVLGALIGDALGVPFEFRKPEVVRAALLPDFSYPERFSRAHEGTPTWTYSDDGAQLLALADSLMADGGLSLPKFCQRLLAWVRTGHYAVGGQVFDIGKQTYDALGRVQDGYPPEECGRDLEQCNGNGSLMRVLPVALWHQGSDLEMIDVAMRSSIPTHPHVRSQVCCAFYCLVARRLLHGEYRSWQDVYLQLRSLLTHRSSEKPGSVELVELDNLVHPSLVYRPLPGAGYVVDSLWIAIRALEQPSFVDAVRWAIQQGYDTDTNACLAGGLAGLKWGPGGIPPDWIEQLRGPELWEPILCRLQSVESVAAPKQPGRILVRAMSRGEFRSFVPPRKDIGLVYIDESSDAFESATRLGAFHRAVFQDVSDVDLTFADRMRERFARMPESARFPMAADIQEIVEAVQGMTENPSIAEIVVACEYGKSRSVAVARGLAAVMPSLVFVSSPSLAKAGNKRILRLFNENWLAPASAGLDQALQRRQAGDDPHRAQFKIRAQR